MMICNCRPVSQAEVTLDRSPKAVLRTLDTLKREDYAIGVIAVALGVEAARTAGKVRAA